MFCCNAGGELPTHSLEVSGRSESHDLSGVSAVMLYRVSDEAGSLETSMVAEGSLSKDLLDPADVFLVDTGKELFVWIGGGASPDEKKNAMPYAHVSHLI